MVVSALVGVLAYRVTRVELADTTDDFLRRRSKISLVIREEEVRASDGLSEVAAMLFGADATRAVMTLDVYPRSPTPMFES